MNEIEKLTQALRDNEDLSFGGIRTLKMIEDVYKKQLVVNVPEADSVQPQLCAVCAYWLEDSEYKGLGACGNDTVHDQLIFGHVDMFLISGDFGCKYFKRK